MTGLVFVDSNVVVYARDPSEPRKQEAAEAWMAHLWDSRGGRLSVQVLNETYNALTRRLSPGLTKLEAAGEIRALFAWDPLPLSTSVVELAFAIEDRFQLSWWDSLIVAAAKRQGCTYLLSEDLQDGQDFDGVRVLDPFSHQPDSVLR